MRGSLWSVIVVGVGLSLMLGATSVAYDPGTASSATQGIADLLEPLGAIIGLTFLVVGTGAFLRFFSGGGF